MERRFWILWMAANITIVRLPSTEPCLAAIMMANPGTVIHYGHTINLTCTLTGNSNPCGRGPREDVTIYTQKTLLPGTLKMDSVIVQDVLPPPGETSYRCQKCKQLCMLSVYAGFPPDRPRSITCEQEGELGNISCSWENGRETFIETTCTLQLWQETHHVTVSSKCRSQANQSLSLPATIAVDGKYTVLVQTSNDLGENVSLPYRFIYSDVVKPPQPSDISVTCHTSHKCTVTIHADQGAQHFRLRYRVTKESAWEQVEILRNRSLILHALRSLSQYEFKAACKYVIDRGKWSNWSDVVTHETPEDAPHGKIEAWYKLHKMNSEVTIFWKFVNLSEFRGHIRFYRVIFQDNVQNTTDTWLRRNLTTEGCVITVSAHNSMGGSAPTAIRVTTHSPTGFPAPTNVTAITSGPESISLHWEMPPEMASAGDQIVAWEDPTGTDQSHTNWILVPNQKRSVTIAGHLKPHICYRFYVHSLWGGRAGLPGITQGSTQQTAPLTGPRFKYEVHKNAILVTWQEIPAEMRMGCITHYSIYLRPPSQKTPINIPSNGSTFYQYEIGNIKKNVQYSLEMTCSNEAGESPASPLLSAYVQPEVSEDSPMTVVLLVVLLFLGLLITITFAKQRLQMAIVARVLPRWWSKPVPDPANCEWAKAYTLNKEKRKILTNVTSSISDYEEDTETLDIEEMFGEDEESPTSVFSYKLHIVTPGITQEEDITLKEEDITLKEDIEGFTHGEANKSQEPDHPPLDYLIHHKKEPSNYLVHHDMKSVDYLDHHDIKPSDFTQRDIESSGFLVHQYIKFSNSIVHNDIQPSNDSLVHDFKPSDYLAQHDIKPSDSPLHQDGKLLDPINPPVYLVHNEIKVDYLPANMLSILEDLRKEQSQPFHHHIFFPSRTNNSISLDSVKINFPYNV
ncbi:interleukin-12 receptor subunit beta-2 [Hyla sarda]|uniref:interleukin-12 receptor subunit beta-2 n=1 Tax=Hyla sarda TaxID=327740 RepID=UPI0024C3A521|nr:interleukin-12 receptor subunit beta-2 [Hyla sarda]